MFKLSQQVGSYVTAIGQFYQWELPNKHMVSLHESNKHVVNDLPPKSIAGGSPENAHVPTHHIPQTKNVLAMALPGCKCRSRRIGQVE